MAEKKFKGIAKDFIKAMKLSFIGQGAKPNEIIVQDLFDYNPPNNNVIKQGTNFISKLSKEDRKLLEGILAIYNQNIETKRELLTQSRKLFENDIIQIIIDVMIDDGFNSFNDDHEEFKIEYVLSEEDKDILGEEYQDQVQNVIDEFIEKFAIKSRIPEIIPELLRDGEYAFGVLFEEGKGITEIVDDLDVINLLPFYTNDKLVFVVNMDQPEGQRNNTTSMWKMNAKNKTLPQFYKPENIVFFRLKGLTKKRINMSPYYDEDFKKLFYKETGLKLPKYIRIPVPIYANAMNKLKKLQLMEDVSLVLNLNEVLKPDIVTVTVPTNTTSEEAKQIIRDYEHQLNDVSDLFEDTDTLDVSTLAAQANRRKVLPQWMDTKGTITQSGLSSTKSESADDTADNLRNLIALSVGVPPFYINLSQSPVDKSQIIKLYSRYTRKLTSLQKTVADGIKDLVMLHCEKRGLNISRDHLAVRFKAITSGDCLDDTDIMVGTVTGINELYKALEEITSSENNNLVMNDVEFKKFFDNRTSKYMNTSNLIEIDENKFKELGETGGEDDFEPSSFSGSTRGRESSDIESIPDFGPEVSGGGDSSYEDFANAEDNIDLEGPQEIIS